MAELYRKVFSVVAVGAAVASIACSNQPSAKAESPDSGKTAKSEGGEVSDGNSPATASASASQATAHSRMFGNADTTSKLIDGRKKVDGTAYASAIRAGLRAMPKWPSGPAALPGAILPANRVVAYYGNPHSKRMGVLGEYPEQQMLTMLDNTVAMWRKADPSTPVVPAIHLVAVVAQGSPGPDGAWRRRESAEMIERSYGWAKSRKGLLILDIQGGHSTLDKELPLLLKYLERPDVHLGVDPEFYMHYKREGVRPSAKVGQMMAADVNYVIQTLDKLVREKNLPPKILVVHRFRADMVPDAESIKPTPRVQVVMDMDGWGPPWLKFDSYRDYIVAHPVQFTGFKIFYHNDERKGDPILTPREVLGLLPRPLYIQYQ
jgi:hypothetical protein